MILKTSNNLMQIVVLLSFFSGNIFCQERSAIRGTVTNGLINYGNVLVVNLSAEKESKTNEAGDFIIECAKGDKLVAIKGGRKLSTLQVSDENVQQQRIFIVVMSEAFELDEVIIEKSNITSESLGIVSKDQKKYSSNEKKLKTAGDFKPIHLLGLIGGSLNVDALINSINGKSTMLKKAVVTEQKSSVIDYVSQNFDIANVLVKNEINISYSTAFIYYLAENPDFVMAIDKKDKLRAEFLIGQIVLNFKKAISN